MPSCDLEFSAALVNGSARLKPAAQGESADLEMDEVVAAAGPDRESDPVQGRAGEERRSLMM